MGIYPGCLRGASRLREGLPVSNIFFAWEDSIQVVQETAFFWCGKIMDIGSSCDYKMTPLLIRMTIDVFLVAHGADRSRGELLFIRSETHVDSQPAGGLVSAAEGYIEKCVK